MNEIFPDCIPIIKAGNDIAITVTQTLTDNSNNLRMQQNGLNTIYVKIDGPQISLPGDMIAGEYPVAGSTQSSDECLPHVVLSSRTLPWERVGPDAKENTPWVALLLFKESELRPLVAMDHAPATTVVKLKVGDIPDLITQKRLINTLKISKTTEVQTLSVPNKLLSQVMPTLEELALLCHVKRTTLVEANDDKAIVGVDVDNAIVISNRLPDSKPTVGGMPERHTAVLISVEQASELFKIPDDDKSTTLIVLHQWTFRPSEADDFEQVIKSIAFRPHGGVLRFGNLPEEVQLGEKAPLSADFNALINAQGYFLDPLDHDQANNAIYRGPLRPFPTPPSSKGFAVKAAPNEFLNAPADTPLDYSHATAFELGRLLALNDPAILEDLREIHAVTKANITQPIAQNSLPEILQMKDWGVNPNPQWLNFPWNLTKGSEQGGSLVKDSAQFLKKGIGDISGIKEYTKIWDLSSIVQEISAIGLVSIDPVSHLNIIGTDVGTLANQFADVKQSAKS